MYSWPVTHIDVKRDTIRVGSSSKPKTREKVDLNPRTLYKIPQHLLTNSVSKQSEAVGNSSPASSPARSISMMSAAANLPINIRKIGPLRCLWVGKPSQLNISTHNPKSQVLYSTAQKVEQPKWWANTSISSYKPKIKMPYFENEKTKIVYPLLEMHYQRAEGRTVLAGQKRNMEIYRRWKAKDVQYLNWINELKRIQKQMVFDHRFRLWQHKKKLSQTLNAI